MIVIIIFSYALSTHVHMVSYLYPACTLNTLRYFRWQDVFSFLQLLNVTGFVKTLHLHTQ